MVEVNSCTCRCEVSAEEVLSLFGRPLLVAWHIRSCNRGPARVGVALTWSAARRRIQRAAEELNAHLGWPSEDA